MVKSLEAKSVCILGRQPALGLAELESLYGAGHIKPAEGAALLDIEAGDINFRRLGGTIKVAKVLSQLKGKSWLEIEKYLLKEVPSHLAQATEGKFTLGLSVYGLDVTAGDVNKCLLSIKKVVKRSGRPVRVVPNKAPALSSAQVLHNKLIHRGAWELIVLDSGHQTILAQTMFVQDIQSYAARDQARPKRDARVGMLPPKLAQIIINLANPPMGSTVLDPFCGTGVVLQEALLMDYGVVGSDINPRMVDYTKTNLDWLYKKYDVDKGGPLSMQYELETGDAISHRWKGNIDAVVSETYLGRPLVKLPDRNKLDEIVRDVNTILDKALRNLAKQLTPDTPLCLALPAWRKPGGQFITLPLIDHLTDMGYNITKFEHVRPGDMIYYRENQVVARQLVVLSKE